MKMMKKQGRTRAVAAGLALSGLAPLAAFAQQVASVTPAASSAPAVAPQNAANPGGPIRWEKTVPNIESGAWKGKRLKDGQPDVEGHWSNTIANHNNWTDPQAGEPGRRPPKTARNERAP